MHKRNWRHFGGSDLQPSRRHAGGASSPDSRAQALRVRRNELHQRASVAAANPATAMAHDKA
jgi:hypothetical protein